MRRKMNIDAILEKSQLKEQDKYLLKELFQGLAEAQSSLFEDISKSIHSELMDKVPQNLNVVTTLAECAKANFLEEKGFFPMISSQYTMNELLTAVFPAKEGFTLDSTDTLKEKTKIYAGYAFLDCSYVDVETILQEKYVGAYITESGEEKEITYSLHKSFDFIQKEKILFKVTQQNNLVGPLIYSPMSRRAFDIYLHIPEEMDKKAEIHLNLEQNKLIDVLLCDKTLYWNIKMTHCSELPSLEEKIVPFLQESMKTFQFHVEENEFIYFQDVQQVVKRTENKIYLPFEEGIDKGNLEYYRIKCYDVPYLEDMELFPCLWKRDVMHKDRIISKADISVVIHEFVDLGLNYLNVEENVGNTSPILQYGKDDGYIYGKAPLLKRPQFLYLVFENSDDKYFCDKISYLLSFMNYYYPEFRFVGVTR